MFAMPILGCIAYQYYIIVMTRTLTNAESILTQILFDYSLKVRIKAEKSDAVSTGVGVGGSESSASQGQKTKGAKKADSFIGRLTNLVTIDMTNVINARDLVPLCWSFSHFLPESRRGSNIFCSLDNTSQDCDQRPVPLSAPWMEVRDLSIACQGTF